jgi:hypothetical protein
MEIKISNIETAWLLITLRALSKPDLGISDASITVSRHGFSGGEDQGLLRWAGRFTGAG